MNYPLYERFKLFIAGGIAGGIGATSVYPIDLVKTRMQTQMNPRGATSWAPVITHRIYAGSIDCAIQTIRHEGIFGMYRGLKPQLLGVTPEKAIKLAANDLVQSLYEDKILSPNQKLGLNVISGSIAGLSQVIVTNPLEITKIRLQIHGELYPHSPLPLSTVVSELGLKGLYRGSIACIMRDVPFSAIYFSTYSYLRNHLTDKKGNISNISQMLAGTLAGVCSASITTPADVVKTRLQMKPMKSYKETRKYKGTELPLRLQINSQGYIRYDGILDTYRKIIKYEGKLSLFKGIVPRVARSAPQFGITLYFYEMFKNNNNHKDNK